MAVKLRLMRVGKKKQPTYRVVAADSRSPRDGRFIEIVGTYRPRAEPSEVEIDMEKAVRWLSKGARPTERVQKLLEISGALEGKGTSDGSASASGAGSRGKKARAAGGEHAEGTEEVAGEFDESAGDGTS